MFQINQKKNETEKERLIFKLKGKGARDCTSFLQLIFVMI